MYEWVIVTKVTDQLLSGMILQVWNMAVFEMNYQVKMVFFENDLFNLRWEVRKKHVVHLFATGMSGVGSNQVFNNPGLQNLVSELLSTGFVFVNKASEGHSLKDAGWLRENTTFATQFVARILTDLAGEVTVPDDVA